MIRRVRIMRREPAMAAIPDVHPVVARVLAGRGVECAPDYALKSLLPPTMGGLQQAAQLLAAAIVDGEAILVVGDFDTDGATGTALAVRALEAMGAQPVRWLVPDRFRHGYGLSPELVADMPGPHPHLLVTVDQGVSSIKGVEQARALGMKVIVTDHHLPGPRLPSAHAIVNPNLPDDPFPSPHPAGVGVMFYVLMQVRSRLRELGWFDQRRQPRLDQWLDLVALGTVADLVALDENNRRLVYQGLERIRQGRCAPGIRALLEIAGRNLRHVSATDLGFAVAPRLNAAGRLDDMGVGIRCLLADSEREAFALAEQLDQLNSERRAIQADMQQRAEHQAERVVQQLDGVPQGLCVFDPDWHQGVVGLVAGRLMERLQRPVIAFAPAAAGATELKGSGRSPAGVHMRDLLVAIDHASPGLVGRFGGHARAAGLSLERSRLEAFRAAFDQQLAAVAFDAEQVLTDGALAFDQLDVATAEALAAAGPWGQAWPEPLFDDHFHIRERRIVGAEHMKMVLQSCQGGPEIDAIAFQAGSLCHQELPDPLHLTYRLEVNRWRGRTRPQIVVQHLVSNG